MVKNALIRYNNFMTNINIKVVAKEGAKLPLYKTSGAAGADICALLEKPLVIESGKSADPLQEALPSGRFHHP